MRAKSTPPKKGKKDSLPLSWILIGIGFLLAIVLMIVLVVSNSGNVSRSIPKRTEVVN